MWVYASDKMLYEYFEGKNLHTLNGQYKEKVKVKDPIYGQEHTAFRFEIEINGQIKSYVSFEVSNGVELYYIPVEHAIE